MYYYLRRTRKIRAFTAAKQLGKIEDYWFSSTLLTRFHITTCNFLHNSSYFLKCLEICCLPFLWKKSLHRFLSTQEVLMGWTIFQKQVPTIYYTVTLTNIVRPSKWSHVVFEALIWLKKNIFNMFRDRWFFFFICIYRKNFISKNGQKINRFAAFLAHFV